MALSYHNGKTKTLFKNEIQLAYLVQLFLITKVLDR